MHDVQLEQSLLGCVLMRNDLLPAIAEKVKAADFFEAIHSTIFEICSSMINMGKLANPLTIKPFLPAELTIGELNVSQYLARLAAESCTANEAPHLAGVIRDLADRRTIAGVGEQLRATQADPSELASWGVEELDKIAVARSTKATPSVSAGESAMRALDSIARAYQLDGAITGISYGLPELDTKTSGLQRGELSILAGRPGMMKAQPLSSKIRTTEGWSTMGAIHVGDCLASINGGDSVVTGVYPQGVKPVFKITFSDGRTTRSCADHLWRVFYRGWSTHRIIPTSEIIRLLSKKRYQGRIWIDLPQARRPIVRSEPSNLPIDPWVLGALIGDGNFTLGRLRFTSAEAETIERMKQRMPTSMELVKQPTRPYCWALNRKERKGGATSEVRDILRSLGLNGLKSYQKFIPLEFMNASFEDRLSLLNGLLDTDGSVQKNSTIRYWTSSPRLAEQVQELARSLGAWCKCWINKRPVYEHNGEKRIGRQAYVLTICYPFPRDLFALSEKKQKAYEYQTARKMPLIESVVSDGDEECQCISVSHPTQLYLTDDYVVTHNTGLALSIARRMSEAGHPGIFFSLEMKDEQLTRRIFSDLLFETKEVPYNRMRSGRVSEAEFTLIRDAALTLESWPLQIEQDDVSLSQIASRARQRKRRHGLDYIIVDHIGHIQSADRYRGNKNLELAEISGGLMRLARELDIGVLALCQLNRAVEARENKRPTLADLRESGAIEQDAATVMFVYRESYYLQNQEPRPGTPEHEIWQEKMVQCLNDLDIIIGKQRDGPTCTVPVYVNPACNAVRPKGWYRDFAQQNTEEFSF